MARLLTYEDTTQYGGDSLAGTSVNIRGHNTIRKGLTGWHVCLHTRTQHNMEGTHWLARLLTYEDTTQYGGVSLDGTSVNIRGHNTITH